METSDVLFYFGMSMLGLVILVCLGILILLIPPVRRLFPSLWDWEVDSKHIVCAIEKKVYLRIVKMIQDKLGKHLSNLKASSGEHPHRILSNRQKAMMIADLIVFLKWLVGRTGSSSSSTFPALGGSIEEIGKFWSKYLDYWFKNYCDPMTSRQLIIIKENVLAIRSRGPEPAITLRLTADVIALLEIGPALADLFNRRGARPVTFIGGGIELSKWIEVPTGKDASKLWVTFTYTATEGQNNG